MKKRRIGLFIIEIIGLLILSSIIVNVGINNIFTEFLQADLFFILLAFIVSILCMVLKVMRWNLLLRPYKKIDSAGIYIISGAINQILPTGSGEISRAYLCKDKLNIPLGISVGAIVIERFLDFSFLIALSIAGLILVTSESNFAFQLLIITLIIILGYLIILKPIYFQTLLIRIYQQIKKIISYSLLDKIFNIILEAHNKITDSIVSYHSNRKILINTIFITIAIWLINGIFFYFILLAFGCNMSLFNLILISAISEIIGSFSFIPGGFGAKDLSFAILLTTQGIPFDLGVTIYLMARLISYIQVAICAMPFILYFHLSKSFNRNRTNE